MLPRLVAAVSAVLSLGLFTVPNPILAQGRQTKVYYDDGFNFGSQPLQQSRTRYFQVLTTPAPEDSGGELFGYWGPKLDQLHDQVCENLRLTRAEVFRYLLYPEYFAELEKLVLERRLHAATFDSLVQLSVAVVEGGVPPPPEPLVFAAPKAPPADGHWLQADPARKRRWPQRYVEWSGDTLFVWLPDDGARAHQRCVLYRTLHDFLATPIGPSLPEGVLGFVPRHDPSLPVVIYASLGEHQLRRTAQHEIAHAIVESIAKYLRALAPARIRNAPRDSAAKHAWRPSRGGFSAITHENYAEYLAFPHGEMEPALRAALIEMVAENRLDGLAAMSVGARTHASSYIEGPARLVFLAENFGRDLPKKLLVGYYTHTMGLLDQLAALTGYPLATLEELYRRWLREHLWAAHLSTGLPDTLGAVLADGLAGVRRDGQMLVERARAGRLELVLVDPGDARTAESGRRSTTRERRIARDLEGIEHLPLFSTADLRAGRVVASVRQRNEESLLIWDAERGRRIRHLRELGAVREVRDPRWSPGTRSVVFRVVDRSGRNAIGCLDVERDAARLLTPYLWAEVGSPSFAEEDSLVLFASTATPQHTSDLFLLDLRTGARRNLTSTPLANELEPVLANGHLLCLSDATGVPLPVELLPDGTSRPLLNPPFAVNRLQCGDSTLALVAASLRHRQLPAGRAVWEFPFRKLGLEATVPAPGCVPPASAAASAEAASAAPASAVAASAGPESAPTASTTLASATPAPRTPTTPAWAALDSPPEGEIRVAAALANEASGAGAPATDLSPGNGDGPEHGVPSGAAPSPYRQKWRLMPIGVNLASTGTYTRGATYVGFDTEFHDRSIVFAVGKSGDFDRFGMVQYRNRAARTHWQLSGFHRAFLVTRYQEGPQRTISSNESEQGLLFTAQYHKSLVTRLGFGMSIGRRADSRGNLVARQEDTTLQQSTAPLVGLRMPGPTPRDWNVSVGGIPDLSLLADRSPAAQARWGEAGRALAADTQPEFLPTQEYVRSNLELGVSLSRDTRVWSDARGPRSGSLLMLSLSADFNAPGTRTYANAAQQDTLSEKVAAGIDRVSCSVLFATHRRFGPIHLALRGRALANDGPGALIYGLGGISTLSGVPVGFIRSQQVAYANLEVRAPILEHTVARLPFYQLPLPAVDGFLFVDSGVGYGSRALSSPGVGLRLRYGFLAYEWRHPFRDGFHDQSGLLLVW